MNVNLVNDLTTCTVGFSKKQFTRNNLVPSSSMRW